MNRLAREADLVLSVGSRLTDFATASQSLFSTAYSAHPYRRPVIGYSHTVEKFARPQLLDFFHRYYHSQKWVTAAIQRCGAHPITL